jgi:hypothetical protein
MTRIRHRTDKYHRQEPADNVRFERYVVDIEHLALEKLPLLQDERERKPIVACSKHLCGAATGAPWVGFSSSLQQALLLHGS